MAYYNFQWTDEITEHLAEHGVDPGTFEELVRFPESVDRSRSTGDLVAFGHTPDGRYLIAVYELLSDGVTVIPDTAYEVPEPRP